MKVIILMFLLSSSLFAELQFPKYELQSKQFRDSWGYKITRSSGSNPSFSLSIPPKAASKCTGFRLYIRNKNNDLLSQIELSPIKNKDGSISISISLFEKLDGKAELIVYSGFVQGASVTTNFGGFTFETIVKK